MEAIKEEAAVFANLSQHLPKIDFRQPISVEQSLTKFAAAKLPIKNGDYLELFDKLAQEYVKFMRGEAKIFSYEEKVKLKAVLWLTVIKRVVDEGERGKPIP